MQKSEKFLIVTALFMFALILGYNAFFVPEIKVSLPNSVQRTNEEKTKIMGKVNINTSSSEELQALNGVGESIAERIIEYRETHGGFGTIEEIVEVRGIGEKVFERLKKYIVI